MTDSTIPAGEERATLFAALRELEVRSQAFDSRGQRAAIELALKAFDTLRARLNDMTADADAIVVDVAVTDRLRRLAEFGRYRRYDAVSIDIADIQVVLVALGVRGLTCGAATTAPSGRRVVCTQDLGHDAGHFDADADFGWHPTDGTATSSQAAA